MDPQFIPAATLVIMREPIGAPPELLMIERGQGMTFAAGALVFPGGRIDPGDRAVAANPALLVSDAITDLDDAAARVAAIRETIEEVGIPVGLDPAPDAAATTQMRAALAEGGDFGALLATAGYRLDLERLTLFARWRPIMRETRNFDTLFYVAAAPEGALAEADGGESVRSLWVNAADALADAEKGHHRIIFPTLRNLERLATCSSLTETIAHAGCHPVETITPWIEERDDEKWLCIPEGRGYPVTAVRLASVERG
jgi:8-oxo-dGTP pyrophosphatase MutT (NUDIX family)